MTQLFRLFQRFADEHAKVDFPGFQFRHYDGSVLGMIEHVQVRRARYHVSGSLRGQNVTFLLGTGSISAPLSGVPDGKFALDLPLADAVARLIVTNGADISQIELPRITAQAKRQADRQLWFPFLFALARLLPPALRWMLKRDIGARAQIKRGLGFSGGVVQSALDGRVLEGASPPLTLRRPDGVTLILPVFNAFDLLPEALDRILRNTDLAWRLVLVEDCSTDPAVRAFLRSWTEAANQEVPGRVHLIESPQNGGFVTSVNLALEIAIPFGHHVVLINSDAYVPAGWASRLIDPILRDPGVASVTPMSNAAEILSVPVICRSGALPPGAADRIDNVARDLNCGPALTGVPTGVGFCMALNIAYLRNFPRLDPSFGRGYGEEVDWCQRTRAAGGRHICQPGLFVEHRSGGSFGTAERTALVAQNSKILSERYPEFDREVQQFVRDDPLLTQRLMLGCAWAGTQNRGPVPIYLAHSMGGGAETCLETAIASDLEQSGAAVVLRVGGPQRWQIELHTPIGITRGTTYEFAHILKMLAPIAGRHIIYSCGVGDPFADQIPACLLALKRTPADRIDIHFHDYFPISPSQNLLNSLGVFQGVPGLETIDRTHSFRTTQGRRLSLRDWRAHWDPLIEAARALVVFSADSRRLVGQAFPDHADRIVLRPHALCLPHYSTPSRSDPGLRPVIGVLGNISRHKGAKLVSDLSSRLSRSESASLVLIGTLDPTFARTRTTRVHGAYKTQDIPHLVQLYGITCWLVPSIWPETFSFTTHEALASGLPVFGFDIGAQGDALRSASNGQVLPFDAEDPARTVLDHLLSTASRTAEDEEFPATGTVAYSKAPPGSAVTGSGSATKASHIRRSRLRSRAT